MKTVLYCHTAHAGGAELAAPELARQLDAEVWVRGNGPLAKLLENSSICTTRLGSVVDRRPTGIVGIVIAAFRLFFVVFEVLILVCRRKPDVLISNTVQGITHVWLAGFLSRTPIIVYIRDLGAGGNRSRAEVSLFTWMCNRFASSIVFNSHYTRLTWNIARPSIAVSTAVSPIYFDSWSQPEQPTRKIVMVGRISEWKGQDRVLQACDLISDELDDIKLRLVGGSLFGEDSVDLAERSIIPELTGHVVDPWNYLSDCDLFVHASWPSEPFGQVVAQAAAAGIPIVCANEGGHLEWLEAGLACITCDARDPRSIADALLEGLIKREDSLARAKVARARAEMFRSETAYAGLRSWIGDRYA